ncbi:hypothetical protein [Kribbella sp. NPDC050459]|uniref:hypothetical protein n=1 Tax=Kribbella sp. NPDC050459 TaxID=3155785 RepID=UPI003400197B
METVVGTVNLGTPIAYLETLVAPVTWDSPNAPAPELFRRLRSPEGEQLVLTDNVFVEAVLPSGTLREQCRRWPNQREVTVAGLHFLPEDSATEISAALLDWIPTV